MGTIEKITNIVNWWGKLPPDFTGLNDVMHARQELSAFSFVLATDMAVARNSWGVAQSELEKKKNQLRVKFEKDNGVTKADYQARANTSELFEMEKKFEAMYFGIKHQYDAITQVLDAMAQRIAILRREWESKNFANGK
jgi:hypothetical protein